MSSYWRGKDPSSRKTSVPRRRWPREYTHPGRPPCDDKGRGWREAAPSQAMLRTYQKPRRSKKGFPCRFQRKKGLGHTSISDLQPPEWAHKFLLSSVCGTSLWQPQEINTVSIIWAQETYAQFLVYILERWLQWFYLLLSIAKCGNDLKGALKRE